jgi:hypothetical protein
MVVIGIVRTDNGIPESANSTSLSVLNSAGSLVLGPVTVPPTTGSPGLYMYTTNALSAGLYTAVWTFIVADHPDDVVQKPFRIDTAVEVSEGVTLMTLEQMTARRCGPYRRVKTGPSGSSASALYSLALKSSLQLGGYEQQYLLRRGISWSNLLVPNFSDTDRIRMIAAYDAPTGILTPDSPWTNAPSGPYAEAVEIHALEPEEELRIAVLDGLKRCYFWEQIQIETTGQLYDINLSSSLPWLESPSQIGPVSYAFSNQRLPATPVTWAEPYRSGKDIWLKSQGVYQGNLVLQVLRPAHTMVNGESSIAGPNDDFDVLSINPDYAAWAAVLEVWKNFPEKVQPLATINMRPSRDDVAKEFTKHSIRVVQQQPDTFSVRWQPIDLVLSQIGNLPEPVV